MHDGERETVERTDAPLSVDRVAADLRELGVGTGETVLVHSSLSAVGWMPGGVPAAVDALLAAVGESGTVAVPTHSTQLSDPAGWENPPVPDEWVEAIRETAPPFRPELTPSRGMGAVPECLRDYPDAVRSRHPTHSFAAWGADAERTVADHAYDSPLGEASPLGRLYEADALVLRVGVEANTSLHLAEYRADYEGKAYESNGGPVLDGGERRWVTFEEPASRDDFREIEAAFERERGSDENGMRRGTVGNAESTLCRMRPLVDFGVAWMEENR